MDFTKRSFPDPERRKEVERNKMGEFFAFLAGAGLKAGEDFGVIEEGKFFLSPTAELLANSVFAEEWFNVYDKQKVPRIDYENLSDTDKQILVAVNRKIIAQDFADDYEAEAIADVISGVVAQRQFQWSKAEFKNWMSKLVRYHSVRALDFATLHFLIAQIFDEVINEYFEEEEILEI